MEEHMDLKQIIANITFNKALSVSEGNLPSGFTVIVNAGIVYDGLPLSQVFEWATANRVIPLQRILRDKCTPEFLQELHKTGLKISASDCGKPITSREDKVRDLMGRGYPQEAAEFAVDNPAEFAAELAKIKKPKGK
jgi:hypothetical protein